MLHIYMQTEISTLFFWWWNAYLGIAHTFWSWNGLIERYSIRGSIRWTLYLLHEECLGEQERGRFFYFREKEAAFHKGSIYLGLSPFLEGLYWVVWLLTILLLLHTFRLPLLYCSGRQVNNLMISAHMKDNGKSACIEGCRK